MKTNLYELICETVDNAQKILDANDPGYTITIDENNTAKIMNPSGVVVAEITGDGIEVKQVLHG